MSDSTLNIAYIARGNSSLCTGIDKAGGLPATELPPGCSALEEVAVAVVVPGGATRPENQKVHSMKSQIVYFHARFPLNKFPIVKKDLPIIAVSLK